MIAKRGRTDLDVDDLWNEFKNPDSSVVKIEYPQKPSRGWPDNLTKERVLIMMYDDQTRQLKISSLDRNLFLPVPELKFPVGVSGSNRDETI